MKFAYELPFDRAVLNISAFVGRAYCPLADAVLCAHLAPPMTWLRHMLTKPL